MVIALTYLRVHLQHARCRLSNTNLGWLEAVRTWVSLVRQDHSPQHVARRSASHAARHAEYCAVLRRARHAVARAARPAAPHAGLHIVFHVVLLPPPDTGNCRCNKMHGH